MRRIVPGFLLLVTLLGVSLPAQQPPQITLPDAPGTVKFLVMGDNGTGERPQYEAAQTMAAAITLFPFDFAIMLGDNMYGSQRPADFITKFERPYKPLLDAGVEFYASLGNHDEQNNRFYKPWNMNGERYYTYTRKNVRFFALDTNHMDPKQVDWLTKELQQAEEPWKVAYFHHPLYSSAGRHGSQTDLRLVLEPLFVRYGVNAVFSGHDHVYERIRPQKGIYYFVSGAAGQLRKGDLQASRLTEKGYDLDLSFMLVEVADDTMSIQALSRTGRSVDSATLRKQPAKPQETSAR